MPRRPALPWRSAAEGHPGRGRHQRVGGLRQPVVRRERRAAPVLAVRLQPAHRVPGRRVAFAAAAFGDDPRRAERDAEYLRQIRAWTATGTRRSGPRPRPRVHRGPAGAARAGHRVRGRGGAAGARHRRPGVGCTSNLRAARGAAGAAAPDPQPAPDGSRCSGAPTARPSRARPPTGASRGWTTWCPARPTAWSRSCAGGVTRCLMCRQLPRGVLGPPRKGGGWPAGRCGYARWPPQAPSEAGPALFSDLDSLPTPRYEDYFAALAASKIAPHVRPGLPLESSRGCWWARPTSARSAG